MAVNVKELCDRFDSRKTNVEIYPYELQNLVNNLCSVAKREAPKDVLTDEDITTGASYTGFDQFGGVEKFAELITKSSIPFKATLHDEKMFYKGLETTSPNEPAFKINDLLFQKVAETIDGGQVACLGLISSVSEMNDCIREITVYPDQIIAGSYTYDVSEESPLTLVLDDIERNVMPESFRSSLYVNDLPYMPGYISESTSFSFGQFNAVHPDGKNKLPESFSIGKIRNEHGQYVDLYIDSLSRFFYASPDVRNAHVYVDSPSSKSEDIYSLSLSVLNGEPKWEFRYLKSTGGCFTGAMNVYPETGSAIALEDLYELYEQGGALPKIAVYDPDKGTVTYQTPTAVTKHQQSHEVSIMALEYKTAGGDREMLEVTSNHYLWVAKDGRELWMRASDINRDDNIRMPNNEWATVKDNLFISSEKEKSDHFLRSLSYDGKASFSYDDLNRIPGQGSPYVYNVIFEEKPGEKLFHNFIVGNEGVPLEEAVIAHNLMEKN